MKGIEHGQRRTPRTASLHCQIQVESGGSASSRTAAPRDASPGKRRAAFTLIEVLAATTVLMIIVLVVGRLFRDSTAVWTLGTRSAQDNMMARAAMDFIAREMAQAVADSNLSVRLNSYDKKVFSKPTFDPWWEDWYNDRIYFVTLANDPDSGAPRAVREVIYFVTNMTEVVGGTTVQMPYRYCLKRAMRTADASCYANRYWWDTSVPLDGKDDLAPFPEILAENLGSFEVWYVGGSNGPSGTILTNIVSYNSLHDRNLVRYPDGNYIYSPSQFDTLRGYQTNQLPAYIEIYLCILEEDDAIKAQSLCEAGRYVDAKNYVDRQGRRYTTRVYLGNRQGRLGGK